MSNYFEQRIELFWDRLAVLVQSAGLTLIHVDVRREASGYVLRCFVGKDPTVTLGDCTRVSGKIMAFFRKDPSLFPINFNLEVSSSGSLRVFGTPEDYRKAKGKRVILRKRDQEKGLISYHQGIIDDISQEGVTLITGRQERAEGIMVPWNTVEFTCLSHE